MILQICYGKQTLAMVRKDAKLPPISATPHFNSHMSVIAPKEKDDLETQFDHSQVYLYELDANKVPNKRPRHCLPYAVLTWSKFNDGIIIYILNQIMFAYLVFAFSFVCFC